MSTKLTKGEIKSAKKLKVQKRERQNAYKRARRKKRRITQQVRVSRDIAIRLKDHARLEKRTMSKIADELIRNGLPASNVKLKSVKNEAVKPFSAKAVFLDL